MQVDGGLQMQNSSLTKSETKINVRQGAKYISPASFDPSILNVSNFSQLQYVECVPDVWGTPYYV